MNRSGLFNLFLVHIFASPLASALAASGGSLATPPLPPQPTNQARGKAGSDQVVFQFDFDERDDGNLESIPKYWEPLRGVGFPRYAGAAFDFDSGRLAPPCFRLDSSGRDVAFIYKGPGIRTQPDTEYRVKGYIQPDQLVHARACVSAHYIDQRGQPMTETLVRTRYVGGPSEDKEWIRFELFLGAAPSNATGIGLVAWVLQESTWNMAATLRRHISPLDVQAAARLDDITVFRLPRVRLGTGVAGNVIAPSDPHEILVSLVDSEAGAPKARLTITDPDGTLVADHALSANEEGSVEPTRVSLSGLPAGWYHARLDVGEDSAVVLTRTLSFVILPPSRRPYPESLAKPLGIVIEPGLRPDHDTEYELLKRSAARSVKVPVWTGLDEEVPDHAARRTTEKFLQQLVKNRFLLTGVLWGPPSEIVRSHGAYQQPLIDLLASDRSGWESELNVMAAPAAGLFRSWQVGSDGESLASSVETGKALSNLRDALRVFMTSPRLAIPVSVSDDPGVTPRPAEQVTISLPVAMESSELAERIRARRSSAGDNVSVFAAPLPLDGFERMSRLGEWARRVVSARHAGADAVYVPQPWQSRRTPQGIITEPLEEFLLLQTVGDVLGDAAPGPVLRIADGVYFATFEQDAGMVAAIWDTSAPTNGRPLTMQLGQASQQIDLWGRRTPLSRDESGRQIVQVSPLPIFVENIEPWLVELTASVSLDPPRVESGTELARLTLEMNYRSGPLLSGQGMLIPPEGITVSPRAFSFSARPDQPFRVSFDVRFAHNEPAGRKDFTARLDLLQPRYRIDIPLIVEIGLSNVTVTGVAVVEHNDLILRHIVHNGTAEVLNFRSTAAAPGRERQYRPITNLKPGGTQTVDYRFNGGRALVGRHIYLALRELNDGPRIHNLELVVP